MSVHKGDYRRSLRDMSRGKQVHPIVRNKITALAWEGNGPAAIERALADDRVYQLQPVGRRTIQRLVKEAKLAKPPEPDGPWSLTDADIDSEDISLIRDVLALVIGPYSHPSWPSRALVQQMIRVRQAAPDIPAEWARALAYAYRALFADGEDARELDMILVLRPWQGDPMLGVFFVAVRCLRSQLGSLDALRWVLADLEVLDLYDSGPGSPVEIDDAPLMGPCRDERRGPRTVTTYPSAYD
jgi:hypothetical protein